MKRRIAAVLVYSLCVLAPGTSGADSSGPPELAAADTVIDLGVREGSAFELYRAIGQAGGLSVLIDPETPVQSDMTAEIRDMTVQEALDLVTAASGHFWVVLNEGTALVAPDEPQHRRAHEAIGIRTFSLENVHPAVVMTSLRSLLGVKNIMVDDSQRLVIARDTYGKLAAAARVVEALDRAQMEVELLVEMLEVDRKALDEWQSRPGGSSRVEPGMADEFAGKVGANRMTATRLGIVGNERARLRMTEGLQVRVPVLEAETASGQDKKARAVRDTGSDRYVDLGIDLQIRAQVHPKTADLTLWLEIEAADLSGPQRGLVRRDIETSVRIADGETLVVPEAVPATRKMSGTDGDRLRVLTVTPRIVWMPDNAVPESFWVGTEANVASLD